MFYISISNIIKTENGEYLIVTYFLWTKYHLTCLILGVKYDLDLFFKSRFTRFISLFGVKPVAAQKQRESLSSRASLFTECHFW